MIKEEAVKNLKDIKGILDELNIPFWLDDGTCLGAYRDKDFCEGDEDDIDLGVWSDSLKYQDTIIEKAKSIGFELHHKWELEITIKRNGSKIDIFFNRKKGEEAYTHLYDGNKIAKYMVVPSHFYERLEPIKFYNMDFLVPSPIEEYLTLKYGDWNTKIHRRDYSCINPNQNKAIRDSL